MIPLKGKQEFSSCIEGGGLYYSCVTQVPASSIAAGRLHSRLFRFTDFGKGFVSAVEVQITMTSLKFEYGFCSDQKSNPLHKTAMEYIVQDIRWTADDKIFLPLLRVFNEIRRRTHILVREAQIDEV